MDSESENAIQREPAGAAGGPDGGTTAATDPAWPLTADQAAGTTADTMGGIGSAGGVGPAGETADTLAAERVAGLAVDLVVDPTGDERVDEALARLGELGRTAVAEHVEIFDDVRHRLQEVLTSIDQDGPRPPAPPSP